MNRRGLLTGMLTAPLALRAVAAGAASVTPVGYAPLGLASGWLGGRVTAADLHGRVTLIDVFTFECINCVRVTPNLKRLYQRYARSDLAIVAVHTPEVPSYQGRMAYLARQRRAADLPWPIAIDNAYKIWNAYGVSAWPTQLLFDREGRLHETIVGDSQDDRLDAAIKKLVRQG